LTWEYVLFLAKSLGLTLADLDNITIGMLTDLAIYQCNSASDSQTPVGDVRMATQADFDKF